MPRKTDERKINFEIDPSVGLSGQEISMNLQVRLEDKGVVIEVEQIGGFCEEDGDPDCECAGCLAGSWVRSFSLDIKALSEGKFVVYNSWWKDV